MSVALPLKLPLKGAPRIGLRDVVALSQGGARPEDKIYNLLAPGATRLQINWPDNRYWFQDAAGTVPVTSAGQMIRCWKPRFGVDLVQSVNSDYAPLASTLPNGALSATFDGVDDYLQSSTSLDFSTSDEILMMAGLRKLMDGPTAKIVCELGTNTNTDNGAAYLAAPVTNAANYGCATKGTAMGQASYTNAAIAAPHTAVLAGYGDISADFCRLRVNGAQVAQSVSDQGTGNFGNFTLFVGRRNGAALPLNARLGPLILRGGPLPDIATIQAVEAIINQHVGAY